MSQKHCVDYVIIGAGIIGLSIARQLLLSNPKAKIIILEKEETWGLHASGRNSGVLHAGIYYPEKSLKAKLCRKGALQLAQYCQEHQLPISWTGKIILPLAATDEEKLEALLKRGQSNGAELEMIDPQQLKTLEPLARTPTGKAIYSPKTASYDAKAILNQLYTEITDKGVRVFFEEKPTSISTKTKQLTTRGHTINFGHLVNCAGLQADILSKQCGVGKNYTILPFKGLFYELKKESKLKINHHIYPVPNLQVPFLGVHFTKTINGTVTIGPTAIPAFGRENYAVLKDIEPFESLEIVTKLMILYAKNKQDFRRFSHQEAFRFFKPNFVKAAQDLVPSLRHNDLKPSEKVGIRAQLFNTSKNELVMDFVVQSGENATHILNAVSPAFTSAFAFAQYVVDEFIHVSTPPEHIGVSPPR